MMYSKLKTYFSSDVDTTPPEKEASSIETEATKAKDISEEEKGCEPQEIVELKKQLEDKTQKLAETHDRMLRIAADFDNTRKRFEKEKAELRQYSIQDFAKDLLPVIDSFDKAMVSIKEAEAHDAKNEGELHQKLSSITEGIKLVSKIFEDTLQKHGIEKVGGKDTPFDPKFHQAIAKTVDESLTQEIILEEFCAGYKIGERVLRASMVRVGSPQ
jgi:molecular chaperone GrpE